jgi:hypothetical protein
MSPIRRAEPHLHLTAVTNNTIHSTANRAARAAAAQLRDAARHQIASKIGCDGDQRAWFYFTMATAVERRCRRDLQSQFSDDQGRNVQST